MCTSSSPLNCYDIYVLLDQHIKEFLSYYWANFPRDKYPNASVLPKMHLLEDHKTTWLRKYHLGAGLMGEQGAESIHAHLNCLEATYSSIPNRLKRLKHIIQSLPPQPKTPSKTQKAKKRR